MFSCYIFMQRFIINFYTMKNSIIAGIIGWLIGWLVVAFGAGLDFWSVSDDDSFVTQASDKVDCLKRQGSSGYWTYSDGSWSEHDSEAAMNTAYENCRQGGAPANALIWEGEVEVWNSNTNLNTSKKTLR